MSEMIKKNVRKIIGIISFMLTIALICGIYVKTDKVIQSEDAISEYMLNTNSMKIHIPTCASVKKMSERNKKLVNAHILDLVNDGYTICFNCYAGLKRRTIVESILDNTLYSNIVAEKPEDLPTREEYLEAVDTMCKWYVEHVPTYLTELEQETIDDYKKLESYIINEGYKGEYIKEYHLYSNYKSRLQQIGTYKVISKDGSNERINSNTINDINILKANEKAIKFYHDNYNDIKFRKSFAYYPCELIKNSEDDYDMAGDDCVRLIFSALNYMDKGFTNKLKKYSKKNWSKITSTNIAGSSLDVAYALQRLGFEVYDTYSLTEDINKDGIIDLQVNPITQNFILDKGDIIARPGHVHFYLGDGKSIEVENFGWGKVNRCYPQISEINVEDNKINYVNILTENKESYNRVYHYIGSKE